LNTFFQFKQFRIEQDQCAMKVCTDSCLFGAYIAIEPKVKRILDIGTGTGLLALMIAQRSEAEIEIDAVEIDPSAAKQARENILSSPWKQKIKVYEQSIQEFSLNSGQKYDLIISNPPFFSKNLKSPDPKVNMAHHNDLLGPEDLISCVFRLLSAKGKFAVMLPPFESLLLEKEAGKLGLLPHEKCMVRDRKSSEPSRIISIFGFSFTETRETQIYIKEDDGAYSSEFRRLLANFYLHL
jgi:tRNA1Val (adenine37-N6)-methyltransferase